MAFQVFNYLYQWCSTTTLKGQSDFTYYSYHYTPNNMTKLLSIQDHYAIETFTTQLDFHTSNNFVLTNCYLLNHWWVAMVLKSSKMYDIFYLFLLLKQQSNLFASTLEKAATIWFSKGLKKPPDPHLKTQKFKEF